MVTFVMRGGHTRGSNNNNNISAPCDIYYARVDVLHRWSQTGGGCKWRFNCMLYD